MTDQQPDMINREVHPDTIQRLNRLRLKDESDTGLFHRIITEVNEYNEVCSTMFKQRQISRQKDVRDKEFDKKVQEEVKSRSAFEINLLSIILDYEMIQRLKRNPNFENEAKESLRSS
jgi:hypothetical protein